MAEIQLLADLAARSLEASHGIVKRSVDGGHEKIEIPAWGLPLMVGTIIVFFVLIFSLEYTLEAVVGTLTMIETPAAPISLSNVVPIGEDSNEPSKDPATVNLLQETEALHTSSSKPITSKIRTTIKHITAKAGFWARWRGFVVFEVYAIAAGLTRLVLQSTSLARLPGSTLLITVLVTVGFSNLHMAWTHAIISAPSRLRWYQRLGDKKAFKALMLPSAVRASAASAVFYLGHGFARLVMGLVISVQHSSDGGSNKAKWLFPLGMIASVLFSILLLLYVYIPAYVTHARVEASLLPESQETIVPFDRSFEGRVLPASLGGPGAVSFVDAWKSFDWEARRRVLKLFAKIILIVTALFLVALHVIGLEAWIITGGRLGEIIRRMHNNHGRGNAMI